MRKLSTEGTLILLNMELKQLQCFADYAKHISNELVLFDWALLRQINVC